jgi:hypothetical protein
MKKLSNPSIYVLVVVAIFAVACKGKTDSSKASDSAAAIASAPTTAQAAKGNSVIDSLQITDGDEVKLCKLYDDVVTEYTKRMQIVLTDTSKLRTLDNSEIDKKFKEESEKLKPEMKDLQVKLSSNPVELMKFEKFSLYEAQRISSMAMKFQTMMKIPK